MIVPTPWGLVPGGARVRLSTGRVVYVLDRIPGHPELVMLRNASGSTRPATVDPAALVDVVFDEVAAAVASLRGRFPHVEFIREGL